MSTETLPKEKKKRIRKPKPTPVQQVIELCGSMTLEEKIEVHNKLKDALKSQRILLEENLKTLEGL